MYDITTVISITLMVGLPLFLIFREVFRTAFPKKKPGNVVKISDYKRRKNK